MNDTILFQALIYLAAAVLCVPLAKKLGLGSVLGYLLAGVAIGPHVLGLVGSSGGVRHFAEFGVVMMLFLVGLELQPSTVWQLRRPIFGMGGLQVAGTAGASAGIALLLGVDWRVGVAVGLIVAMSSTAIVLQSLGEKGLLKTSGGQSSFSVLLFQDLAVIPILAVFPLLGAANADADGAAAAQAAHGHGATAGRPGWMQGLMILGAVGLIIVAGRFLVRPAFRMLAATKVREIFTAFALMLVVGIAFLMDLVGLSPALGTFLAGVVLAESEYRHELEGDIEPFKGLLLGLFFISVGSEIDFALIAQSPLRIAGLVVGVVGLKFGVLLVLGKLFHLDRAAKWLVAIGLAQVGEFAFVLIGFGETSGVLRPEHVKALVAVTALSMLVTPLLFILLERLVLPWATRNTTAQRPHDTPSHDDAEVVMAGYGRVGQVVGRLLRASGHPVTVLDLDPEFVDLLTRLGQKVYYGDASRLDLLVAAGCEKAKLFVLAIDDVEKSCEVAELVRRQFPKLTILARARNRQHYYRLRKLGITHIVRETLMGSLELGQMTLRLLGVRAHTAHRYARKWRAHDELNLETMFKLEDESDEVFYAEAKKALANMEQAMRDEFGPDAQHHPGGDWDNESLRAEVNARAAAREAEAAAQAAPPREPGA